MNCKCFYTNFSNYVNINETYKFNIKIYPNPSTGIINIKSDGNIEKVEIFDINGKQIKQIPLNNKLSSIDLSKNAKGIYFVKLISGDTVSVQKVILK